MNNITPCLPLDSLGRRIGIANDFVKFNDIQLSATKNDLSLSMGLTELKYLQENCKSSKQSAISLDMLYFIDEIYKASLTHSQNALIYDLMTENEELAITYNDLQKKHKANFGECAHMISVKDALGVYPIYAKSIGLKPKDFKDTELKKKLNDNTAFLYLYSDTFDDSYYTNAEAFISSEDFSNIAYLAKRIDTRGIAYTLATLCDGIYADLYSIPGISKTPELSHLATEAHGRYIVAVAKESIDKISSLAESFSLKCAYFARVFSNSKFTLRNVGRAQMSLDTSVILNIGNGKFKSTFTLEGNEYIECQNMLVDSLMPSLALGAALEDITVSANYNFSDIYDEAKKSDALCATLGAYRAMAELCVAATEPTVTYDDTEHQKYEFRSHCDCSQKLELSDVKTEAYVYLLSFNKNENGTPDYTSLRAMSKASKSIIANSSTLLAIPATSSLRDIVNELLKFLNVGISKKLPFSHDDKLSGIVILSTEEIKNGMFLGMVAPAKPAQVPDAESINNEI